MDLPIINPNWLGDPADQEVAISIFKRIREAFTSKAMSPIVLGEEYYPGNHVQSDSDILEYIKNNVMTLWHAACTCKMGTSEDKMAVIDSQARVFGVENLRVVDASSFPFLPPGHPQSTVCKCLVDLETISQPFTNMFRYACGEDFKRHHSELVRPEELANRGPIRSYSF